MAKVKSMPVALTIAGSDSGGGAGIQADLKTFAAYGVHGLSAVTGLTAQNPRRILAVKPCPPGRLRQQLDAIWEEFPPLVAKTGMLVTAAQVRVLVDFFQSHDWVCLIIDPVMVSSSGTRLLPPDAYKLLIEKLLPLAALVTPNLDEATLLTGRRIKSVEDLRTAARTIQARYGCAALVKGGHLANTRTAVDIYYDGKNELILSAPFVRGLRTHGTGCTYSAAITAGRAADDSLQQAVTRAKHYITRAIAGSYRIGDHFVLGHFA